MPAVDDGTSDVRLAKVVDPGADLLANDLSGLVAEERAGSAADHRANRSADRAAERPDHGPHLGAGPHATQRSGNAAAGAPNRPTLVLGCRTFRAQHAKRLRCRAQRHGQGTNDWQAPNNPSGNPCSPSCAGHAPEASAIRTGRSSPAPRGRPCRTRSRRLRSSIATKEPAHLRRNQAFQQRDGAAQQGQQTAQAGKERQWPKQASQQRSERGQQQAK
ncbi:hypothetical protein D3C76_420120 [compost metagenome]